MNQQPGGGGGNGGFPGGSINPQALQAALGQAQQQQGQGGNAAMMGMGMGTMNPALLQQQQSQQSNNMGGGGGGGGQGGVSGGNDVGSSQQQQGNSMIPGGLPPQNAVAMLQALRGNMNNLQGQWSNVASQPDSPAKQQEQTRLATEMKRLKGIHDQLINMLRSQQGQQQQQQQQGARPQQQQPQAHGQQQQQMGRGQQQAPATPTQANAGSPPPQQQQGQGHQSRPSMQMQDPSTSMQGMTPYGQAAAGMAMGQGQGQGQGGRGQGFPGTPGSAGGMGANGMPFGAENPQHQSQLAALQAFAQQQQQRQQQQSQHHGTPQQQHGTPQGMTGTPQLQNQQPAQQQGMMPPGPPQQQQQQQQQQPPPPPTPSQAPPLPPGLSNLSQFTAILGSFMTQRGTPFPPNAPMTFVGPAAAAATPNSNETRPIELNALFAAVVGMGGSARLSSTTVPGTSSNVPQALTGWIILANKLGLAVANPDPQGEGRRDQVPTPAQTPERLRNWYRERLAPFEEWWMNRSKQQQQQQQQQGGGAAAGTPGPGQSNPATPMQQQAQQQQQQQQQQQRPDSMPGPSSQQGYGIQQQMMQGQQQPPPQQQQQQQPGARPPAQGAAPPLTPAQQQAIQQLAHQLQRAVAEGKLSSEDARNRFMQAQAAIRGQGAPPQQQQGAGPMQGQPSAGPSNIEPAQAPTPAASTTSETPDQKGAGKKRPRKSGGQNAAGGGAAANKGAKMPKMEYGEGTPTTDTRPASRQGSMQAPGTPVGGMPLSAGPSAMPQMPPQQQPQAPQLTPKTAMRMLQQGNLNPAQQAAALAAVRAGSQAQAQAQQQQQQQQQQNMRPPSSAGAQGPLPPPPFGAHPQPDGMNDPTRQAPQPYQQQPPPPQQQQQPQAPPQPAPPAPEPHPPNKYKVEYLPLRRDISTHGGWSLSLIDQELTPFTRGYGKQPRSVRELGTVDISAIVFSLKSGLEVEVSWALNTLLVLSSGSGVRYDAFHVGLAHCGDLLEELVGVLERSALCAGLEDEKAKALPSFDIEGKSTHADWVAESLEAEEEAKLFRRATSFNKRQSNSSRSSAEEEDEAVTPPSYHAALLEEREKSRKADLAMTVLDILRNFASMQQNVDLLARHTRLLELLGKMVERNDDGSSSPSHVFTPTEHLRIRKDVLFLLSCISGPTLRLPTLPTRTVASLFDLLCSFLVDGASIEELAGLIYDYPPAPPPQQPNMPPPMRPAPVPWAARVPHYAEMALDSFARFAQPDANRRLLSTLVPESTLFHLAQTLVRMLPCSDVDFSLFRTEARLAYTEHIAMCLYNVVFMASSRLKARLRNRTAGWVGAVWRVVKKTARQGQAAAAADGGNAGQQQQGSFTQNPFSALIFRLVETLKLVDEARDLFDLHPSLAFAGQEDSGRGGSPGEGEVAVSTSRMAGTKKKAPLLALEEMDVVQLLATPGMDPVLVGHLSSMIEG